MTTINIQTSIYQELQSRYKKSSINKRELANELSCSVSAINNKIVNGYGIPQYKKLGNAKNAHVIFPIVYLAEYLSNTILVA